MHPGPELSRTGAAPTREDPTAAAASAVIGGPLGRYAAVGRRGWAAAGAVLAGLSSVFVALGVLQKAHCVKAGWVTPDQFWHACYSDLPLVYQTAGLTTGSLPYGSGGHGLDQPVVSGLAMWLVALVVPGGSVTSRQLWYFGLWAVLTAVLVAVLVVVTAASVRVHPWRAAHVALSPVLVTAALVSVDLLGVLLAAAGLLAWGRRRVGLAGVLLGLAIAARSYPLVLLAAIGLLAVRSGQLRAWAVLAGTALGTWLVVTAPWLVLNPGAVLSPYRVWWRAAAGYGSPWLLPSLAGHPLAPAVVTALAVLGWLAALALGAAFALGTRRRPGVAEVALVMLVVVVVTGKAVPVQAALWVLPLLALSGPRWRDHLIWAGAEVASFVAVWLYIAGLSAPDRGLPPGGYSVFLLARLAALTFLLVQVWRLAAARRPVPGPTGEEPWAEGEPGADEGAAVERVEELDELAGPLHGAPDRVLVRFA